LERKARGLIKRGRDINDHGSAAPGFTRTYLGATPLPFCHSARWHVPYLFHVLPDFRFRIQVIRCEAFCGQQFVILHSRMRAHSISSPLAILSKARRYCVPSHCLKGFRGGGDRAHSPDNSCSASPAFLSPADRSALSIAVLLACRVNGNSATLIPRHLGCFLGWMILVKKLMANTLHRPETEAPLKLGCRRGH